MRKLAITTALLIFTVFGAFSQKLECDGDEIMNWEMNFLGGLNKDGSEFDIGIAHFPAQYVGFKLQLGMAGEVAELSEWWDDDYDYAYGNDYYSDYTWRFKATFSVVLRSPMIIKWERQNGGFYLFAEPGIILSPGASGSRNAQWFSKDLKTGINLQFNRCIFSVGFEISDFSLYSGYPNSHWGTRDNDRYTTYSGFFGIGYKF